ncbi:hypothetical protein HWV62_22758 [Athelia sp. TMB]|nr:hypothetical protein HWV62_22758 [Athelia sp. TMB]
MDDAAPNPPQAQPPPSSSSDADTMPGVPLRTHYAAQRKRAPVPLILESFPAPPSFIPPAPAPTPTPPAPLPHTHYPHHGQSPPPAYAALHALATSPPSKELLGGRGFEASGTQPFLSRSVNSPPRTPLTAPAITNTAATPTTPHERPSTSMSALAKRNPPPSAPPAAPLPPVPGPSPISDHDSVLIMSSTLASKRSSRASIMSATLPRTSFSAREAYVHDEGKDGRETREERREERRERRGGSKRNSGDTLASVLSTRTAPSSSTQKPIGAITEEDPFPQRTRAGSVASSVGTTMGRAMGRLLRDMGIEADDGEDADQSLASIDIRDIPAASPDASPVLSRAAPQTSTSTSTSTHTLSLNTPVRPRKASDATPARPRQASDATPRPKPADPPAQLAFPTAPQDDAAAVHLKMRAARSKSESHKRALALRSPPPASPQVDLGVGAGAGGSGSAGTTPRATTPSSLKTPKSRNRAASASTTTSKQAQGHERTRSASPDIAAILATTPRARPRHSTATSSTAPSSARLSASTTRSSGSYGSPVDPSAIGRPPGVRRYASEGAKRGASELAYLHRGEEPDEFGMLPPHARGQEAGTGGGSMGTKRVSWDDAFARSAPQARRRGRAGSGLGSGSGLGAGGGMGGGGGAVEEAWGELESDGEGSDSSLDLHTPLPHLMLRHGLLSPHSKLLPDAARPRSASASAVRASVMSTDSSMTKSGLFKDARDTPQRRVRHRDGRQLRAGMGLTTGLGWSDSEDEDAPSPLTRRLSTLNLSRSASAASLRSAHHPLSRAHSYATLPEESEPASSPRRPRVPPSSWSHQPLTLSTAADADDTPSTASTASLPLPVTPDDAAPRAPAEKGLPPLPPPTPTSVRALKRYPSNLTLRTPRERTLSGTSSVSMSSTGAMNGHYPLAMPPTPNPPLPAGLALSSSQSTPAAPSAFKAAHPPRPLRLSQSVNLRVASAAGAPPLPTQPGQGQSVLGYNRNVMDAQRAQARARTIPTPPGTPSPGAKPMPRTGTGMVYRTSSSSRMRAPAPRTLTTSQSLGSTSRAVVL